MTTSAPSWAYGAATAGPSDGARRLDQAVGLGGDPGPGGQALEDAGQVADADLLLEQVLQHALHVAEREGAGHQLVDDRRVLGLDAVDQGADVLAAEQAGGVGGDHLRQVRDQHRGAVDDGGAGQLGLVPQLDGDPAAGEAEDRLGGGRPGQGLEAVAEGEHAAGRAPGRG